MKINFKKNLSFCKRLQLYKKIVENNENLLPIIIQVYKKCKLKLNKEKWLIDPEITISELLIKLREQTNVEINETIFIFNVEKKLLSTMDNMKDVYKNYKDDDGFLYLIISLENTIQPIDTYNILDLILYSGKNFVNMLDFKYLK